MTCKGATTFLYFLVVLGTLFNVCSANTSDSCVGRCGGWADRNYDCQCNSVCVNHNDCCQDYNDVCVNKQGSCKNRCGDPYDNNQSCQCNSSCEDKHDCCKDYQELCNNNNQMTMEEFSEKVFSLEKHNVGDKILLNTQCHTTVGNPEDCSPNPLFASVDESVFDIPVYKKLYALMNNYEKRVWIGEHKTAQEEQEEKEFMDIVMESEIMQATYKFLQEKGKFSGSYQQFSDKLMRIWFNMYPRSGSHSLTSSGFEHVYSGEVKNGDVSGQHSWLRWYTQERAGHMNYLGFWKRSYFGDSESGGLLFTYNWDSEKKPFGSMLLGTSPELELALYSACFLVMPDKHCPLKMGGQKFQIQTWKFTYDRESLIGSAYPDFD